MDDKLKDRLNQVLDRITSPKLLDNRGLGSEIGFYIFDYPPEAELDVRRQVDFVVTTARAMKPDLRIATVNLFTLLVDYLRSRNLLDKALKIQREKGDAEMFRVLKAPLHEEKIARFFVDQAQPDQHDLMIVTGVGSVWPLLRSHALLNNLQKFMGRTPLVVFYPGQYDGQSLRLFGISKDDNYYRAFRLVE